MQEFREKFEQDWAWSDYFLRENWRYIFL